MSRLFIGSLTGSHLKSFQFIVGSGKQIVLIQWDGKDGQAKALSVVGEVEKSLLENRFNDAKCDPSGRFFGGTMRIGNTCTHYSSLNKFKISHNFVFSEIDHDIFEMRLGTFYRFTSQEQFVALKGDIGVSNGLTWNEKTNKFYFIDSCDLDVKEFDYDPKTGNICK